MSQVPMHRWLRLAIVGGMAFWLTNLAISLTPIAAEYRAALSISYLPMLVESLLGGLAIGAMVSFLLLRYFDSIPGWNALTRSMVLSAIILVLFTILLEGPSRFFTTNDPWRFFLIGALINVLRIMALGATIGVICKGPITD